MVESDQHDGQGWVDKALTAEAIAADTIVAVATAPGRGGIGIVRLSGPGAVRIGQTIAGRTSLTPRFAHFSSFRNADDELLDQGLVLSFPAPASFTGEDVVELQGHGGPVVLDLLVARALELGARLATPGEFSLRGYLNDKMDLAQAEAVADLIDSSTQSMARAAARSVVGEFSRAVAALKAQLIALRVHVEAAIDFPEEEIDFLAQDTISIALASLQADLARLIPEARQGVLLGEGITLVLAGRPNAGKSSLLNRLAKDDRAIVSERPGTTRDIVRARLDLDGLLVEVLDTAGLRDSVDDPVEGEGVQRAHRAMADADCIVLLVDASQPRVATDVGAALQEHELPATWATRTLLVVNKIDLVATGSAPAQDDSPGSVGPAEEGHSPVFVSARTGAGVGGLIQRIKSTAGWSEPGVARAGIDHTGGFSARRRHLDGLQRAEQALSTAARALAAGAGELAAEDLRVAQQELGVVVGDVSSDDLLGHIFSSFCIGK